MQPDLISVLLPTTGRPARALACVQRLLDTTPDHPLEIICPVDADPTSRDALQALLQAAVAQRPDLRFAVPYAENYQGCSLAWNQALAQSHGEYIVFAADDLVWGEGWLDEALRVMAELPAGGGLVGFNDGHWDGNELSTHYLLSRRFILDYLGGVIAWPCYQHSFNDLEVNLRAKQAGRFAWAKQALVAHEHWTYGTRPQDDSDRRFLPAWTASHDAFERRQAAGFPCDYPPFIWDEPDPPAARITVSPEKRRIGWLIDTPPYVGGAELTARTLAQAAPDWAQLVPCASGYVSQAVDAYVIHNCVQYGAEVIRQLQDKPVIKVVHDAWPHGDPALRAWLLAHAALLIFFSQLQRNLFDQLSVPATILPVAVNLAPFRQARQRAGRRAGTVWLGQFVTHKGIQAALNWAQQHQLPVDFYGEGPLANQISGWARYRGVLEPEQVPAVLARYERLLFLPAAVEPFGRVVVEAWAAGCQLVTNQNVGALEWLREQPAALDEGAARFWQTAAQHLGVTAPAHATVRSPREGGPCVSRNS